MSEVGRANRVRPQDPVGWTIDTLDDARIVAARCARRARRRQSRRHGDVDHHPGRRFGRRQSPVGVIMSDTETGESVREAIEVVGVVDAESESDQTADRALDQADLLATITSGETPLAAVGQSESPEKRGRSIGIPDSEGGDRQAMERHLDFLYHMIKNVNR